MGGRGKSSGVNFKQIGIGEFTERLEIRRIIEESANMRAENLENGEIVGGIGGERSALYKKCVCCREYSISIKEVNFICPVCGWIDDLYQNIHPDSFKGKNSISLNQARKKYKEER